NLIPVFAIPEDKIPGSAQRFHLKTAGGRKTNLADEVFAPKHLIHQTPDEVNIFIRDLDEAGAGGMEQFLSNKETVAEITEIRMDPQLPCVAKGFDLFRLAAERFVIGVAHGAIV